MAIYEGAGIHGTEETYSLGSAASHGCVRMAIPDVEELYDRVEVGTPILHRLTRSRRAPLAGRTGGGRISFVNWDSALADYDRDLRARGVC